MPEIVRHPLIWDEISVCRDHGIKCFIEEAADAAAAAERARIRAAVEALDAETRADPDMLPGVAALALVLAIIDEP